MFEAASERSLQSLSRSFSLQTAFYDAIYPIGKPGTCIMYSFESFGIFYVSFMYRLSVLKTSMIENIRLFSTLKTANDKFDLNKNKLT